MRTLLTTSASAGALLIGMMGAQAADVVRPAPFVAPVAPVPVTLPLWNGHYLGIVGGVGLLTATGPGYYYEPYYELTARDWGGSIGVTAGSNHQFGNAVLGIEADWSAANFKASEVGYYTPDYYIMRQKWDQIATLRARAGLAVGNALVYATAGIAAVHHENEFCYSVDSCSYDYYGVLDKKWTIGLAAGAGAEWMLNPRTSLKLEYLFVGLPTEHVTSGYQAESDYTPFHFLSDVHMVRFGINWHFN